MGLKVWVPTHDASDDQEVWQRIRSMSADVHVGPENPPFVPDAICCMSISRMSIAEYACKLHPRAKLFVYNWDVYETVWTQPTGYDYRAFGELCKQAAEVWVPSQCTADRTQEYYGVDAHVVLAYVDPLPVKSVRDKNYVLCALRQIPDRDWGLFEQACRAEGIRYHMTEHKLDWTAYIREVVNCTFVVSHCHELSTGGLTLLEAYALGKPVLLSDSPWHGGSDYFGDRASYFRAGDIASLRSALRRMWDYRASQYRDTVNDLRWVEDQYSAKRFAADLRERVRVHCSQ